jgi:hypothetical protein
VARDAGADHEVQHGRGVVGVLDEREAAGLARAEALLGVRAHAARVVDAYRCV